jgi:hypothetical protein
MQPEGKNFCDISLANLEQADLEQTDDAGDA